MILFKTKNDNNFKMVVTSGRAGSGSNGEYHTGHISYS